MSNKKGVWGDRVGATDNWSRHATIFVCSKGEEERRIYETLATTKTEQGAAQGGGQLFPCVGTLI